MSAPRWIAALGLLSALTSYSQPALTTVQDTIYKADGARFDGYAFIEWKSFDTPTGTVVGEQSVVVRITGGNLRVQLIPTTDVPRGAYYHVKYHSDGRIQFQEYWAVRPSTTPLRLTDVRTTAPGSGSSSGSAGNTIVTIPDVVGLQDELNARPIKGGAFVNGRTVVASPTGALNTVSGNLSDCVRVDGSTIPCTTGPMGVIDNETLAGTIDGVNAVFTLANAPNPPGSLAVYRNGVRLRAGFDYTLSTNTITFLAGAIPRTGDSLVASYRTGSTGDPTPVGEAGGHLTGYYPDPQIAAGVISDHNISASAGIAESKLALNHPTHSNANDPTAAEKAAMAGTSGVPSATNRFVTAQDSRLADARMPLTHGLLNASHGDTVSATPVRGDLIVAQGGSAMWSRLPLGAANRCLTSNGLDAVWNACLFTGFANGSVPVVNSTGVMAPSAGLVFDPANLRLSVGNNTALATGYFWNSTPVTGSTTLAVRAGAGQGSTLLQRWINAAGTDVASINADGAATFRGIETRTTSQVAGYRDLGSPVDPATRMNGDMWYNTAQQARKTMDAGQIHTQAQILCNSTGGQTSNSARLGSCFIPEFFFDAGDRIEIHFNYEHTGTTSDWNFGVAFGPATLLSRNVSKDERLVTARADGAIHGSGLVWGIQSWGSAVYNFQVSTNTAAAIPTSAFLAEFYGTVLTPGTDTVKLLNFTVIRYPAIANPN
jgi:hypothetical protein